MNMTQGLWVRLIAAWIGLSACDLAYAGPFDDLKDKLTQDISDAAHKGIDTVFGTNQTDSTGSSQSASSASPSSSKQQTGGGSKAATAPAPSKTSSNKTKGQ